MGLLADQFLKAGVIKKEDFERHKAAEAVEEMNAPKQKIADCPAIEDLISCKTINEFRYACRKILLKDRSQIWACIKIAHGRFKGQEGSKKLFWILYQVRDNLSEHPNDYERIINRAFRRSGSVADLPEDLL